MNTLLAVLATAPTLLPLTPGQDRIFADEPGWTVHQDAHRSDALNIYPSARPRRYSPILPNRITDTGGELWRWTPDAARVSPDGQFAVMRWSDGLPKGTNAVLDLFRLSTGRRVSLPDSNASAQLAWSPDSRWIAASGGNTVRAWNVENHGVRSLPSPKRAYRPARRLFWTPGGCARPIQEAPTPGT